MCTTPFARVLPHVIVELQVSMIIADVGHGCIWWRVATSICGAKGGAKAKEGGGEGCQGRSSGVGSSFAITLNVTMEEAISSSIEPC